MIPVSLYCHLVISEEQQAKITHRKRYIKRGNKKSKKSDKNDDLDVELLDDNSIDSFGGSHAELEVSAERLFTSPPQPQPLAFDSLKFNPTSRSPWDLVLIYRLIKRWGLSKPAC